MRGEWPRSVDLGVSWVNNLPTSPPQKASLTSSILMDCFFSWDTSLYSFPISGQWRLKIFIRVMLLKALWTKFLREGEIVCHLRAPLHRDCSSRTVPRAIFRERERESSPPISVVEPGYVRRQFEFIAVVS